MLRVPDDLVRTISSYGGDAGNAWLAALPGLVGDLADEWSLAVGAPYQPCGVTALVLPATRADGTPCALKLRFPEPGEHVYEADALRHYAGGAAVALLAEDERRTALLLERCDPGTPLSAEPDDTCATIVATLLGELWSAPPAGHPYPMLSEVAQRWAATVSGSNAVDRRLRDEVTALLRDLGATADDDPVVLHGDLHGGNVLRAVRRPWLAIDPKGRAGDRTFDCAALLRDRATPETVPRRLAIVVEALGVDPARVRGWALAQAVDGAAWSYDLGDVAGGDSFADAARVIAALPY